MPQQTGTPKIILIAQSLLYFSLSSTLLAALLAVLGKQWLLHYDSVGEKGTIEERGLERQRKFTGLQSWKFDIVMQIFPLLLQLSLLLFAAALSIYLWTIHHVIAAIVLSLTGLGAILYTAMIISAVASPDSPFQTSLSFLLARLVKTIFLPPTLHRIGRKTWRVFHIAVELLSAFFSYAWSATSSLMKGMPPLLPQFKTGKSSEQTKKTHPILIFDHIPERSEAVPAVIWALETTTDPRLVETAAAMVPDLQWPTTLDLRPSLRRLSDIFHGCFVGSIVQESMEDRANACIKAFGLLNMFTTQDSDDLWELYHLRYYLVKNSELRSAIVFFQWARGRSIYPWDMVTITTWSLRFISGQHLSEVYINKILEGFQPDTASLCSESVFADFLFCMISFFAPSERHDLSLLDKRYEANICSGLARLIS
jgi:hypothetical protein